MNVVIVQLGNPPKAFFWENLDNLSRFHSINEIYVISDLKEVVTRAQKQGFKGHLYITPASLIELFSRHSYSKKFRNGFWQYSALRLFALLDFCQSSDDGSALHIESDVLLMPNFPFADIARQNQLMWFNFNDNRDVASLVWIPSKVQASWMYSELFKIFSQDSTMTDMTALRKLKLIANNRVSYFPSKLNKTNVEHGASNFESLAENNHYLPIERGIFDGASIGMWLTGEDPMNHRGMLRRLRHLSDGPIDLRARQFRVIENCLYLVERDSLLEVYNLHIHSKNRYLFGRNGKIFLRIFVALSNKKVSFPIFLPMVFLNLALNKCKSLIK